MYMDLCCSGIRQNMSSIISTVAYPLDEVCSISPASELLPLDCSRRKPFACVVNSRGKKQLECRQNGSNLIRLSTSSITMVNKKVASHKLHTIREQHHIKISLDYIAVLVDFYLLIICKIIHLKTTT